MSLSVIVIALKCKFGGSQRKLIGIKLADCADDKGKDIFPSHETLAAVAECSTKTVQRTLNEWINLNLLYNSKPNGTNGRVHLNYNMFFLEALADGDVEFYKTNPGSRDPAFSLRSTQNFTGRSVQCGRKDMDGPSSILDGPSLQVDGPSSKSDGPSTKPLYNLSRTCYNHLEGGGDEFLKALFEEFKLAVIQFKFVVPKDLTFKVNKSNFQKTIESLGVEEWREALSYAKTDKACTGQLPPLQGHEKPWRLSFVKMCETDWLIKKLDCWRDQNPVPPIAKTTAAIMITPDHECWNDWLEYYKANQPGHARLMEDYKKFAVETKTPQKL